jgi:cyclopropane fatty-acyl-phospholipid synthase-like methyltransferase
VNGRLATYYDWLSRYQRLAARLRKGGGYESLTVHRLMSEGGNGNSGGHVLHDRLLHALPPLARPRVVDAGCGFGGTVFFLHAQLGGEYDGLTLSSVQHARAEAESRRRGLTSVCRFHVRSYDDDLTGIAPEGVDLVVAIESIAHAARPARTIAGWARTLRPNGVIAIVDDMPIDSLAPGDRDFEAFRRGWLCPAIAGRSALVASLRAADLDVARDENWSLSFPRRNEDELERLVQINRKCRRLCGATALGVLLDSLHGGLMLERLYRRGLMEYRFLLARKR